MPFGLDAISGAKVGLICRTRVAMVCARNDPPLAQELPMPRVKTAAKMMTPRAPGLRSCDLTCANLTLVRSQVNVHEARSQRDWSRLPWPGGYLAKIPHVRLQGANSGNAPPYGPASQRFNACTRASEASSVARGTLPERTALTSTGKACALTASPSE